MTEKAFVLGQRIVGLSVEDGVFIAPPGRDAGTASADDLLLHITASLAQIAIVGVAAPTFPRVIPHGLGYPPIVLPNMISTDVIGLTGYVRPSNSFNPYRNSIVKSETTQLTVDQVIFGGANLPVNYFVYNRRAP